MRAVINCRSILLAVHLILLLLLEARAFWIGGQHSQSNQKSTRLPATTLSKSSNEPNRVTSSYSQNSTSSIYDDGGDDLLFQAPDIDAMRARAGVLRKSILLQQLELQHLERQIVCCSHDANAHAQTILTAPSILHQTAVLYNRTLTTFRSSSNVLLRKLQRVEKKSGPNNQRWKSVGDYVVHQTRTAGRIAHHLIFRNTHQLRHLVDRDIPTLLPHVPAILARLDRLEIHVSPILEKVLNNQRHLASIEPYLDEILERFDDIEPHLPWILQNIDVLAPYTGLLLKHIDELLLYADVDEHERQQHQDEYALADQLLPFLEFYVSRLDVIGPHLPLLRPHVHLLLKKNRIAKVSPHINSLFRRGYVDLNVSANLDVLLFYFGWALNVPGVPRLFFLMPFSPRLCSVLARKLPKRMVRGYCSGVSCQVDGDYGGFWNRLSSKSSSHHEEQKKNMQQL